MKIWQLDPANLTPYYDKALCTALSDIGQNVCFFTSKYLYDKNLSYPKTFTVEYHYFQYLERPSLANLSFLRRGLRAVSYPFDHWSLYQKIKKHKPDVLHIQWSRVPVFDLWLIKRVQTLGIPIIHTVHDVIPLFTQGRLTGNLADVFSQVDALIVHTEDSRDRLLELYPSISSSRIHKIPHLDEGVFIASDANRTQARKYLNIEADTPVILFFGNIKHYKGVDLLSDIFQLTKQAYPDLQLWIVGKPDTEDDKLIVDSLKTIDGIHIRDSFIPYEELWIYHYATDISIYPYRDIFQSGALLAGLGFGCPVIVTNVGGLPENIDGNGWVVPPENVQVFADTLIEALSDKERLQKMGKRSRQIVDQRFGANPIAQQHLSLYQQLRDKPVSSKVVL